MLDIPPGKSKDFKKLCRVCASQRCKSWALEAVHCSFRQSDSTCVASMSASRSTQRSSCTFTFQRHSLSAVYTFQNKQGSCCWSTNRTANYFARPTFDLVTGVERPRYRLLAFNSRCQRASMKVSNFALSPSYFLIMLPPTCVFI